MRRLTVLGALLAALALPALADAHPTVQDSLRIAYAADPNAPCVGHVTILWDRTLALRNAEGMAYPGTCNIAIDPAIHNPDHVCDLIVHEVKHLAGYEHTKTGIMAPNAGEWPACHPRLTRRQWFQAGVRDMLPSGYAWRVSCDRSVSRCWAKARGAQIRRYRITSDDGIYER